jgi:hypothetical protein
LGIENFSDTSKSRLSHWFNHAKNNHSSLEGDIFEFGVYKGNGVIAMGLLLKILESNKHIYAFDSFKGFPNYHEKDDLEMFKMNSQIFGKEIIKQSGICKDIAEWRIGQEATPSNISTSGDFSDASKIDLENRIKKFELDNITIIDGNFSDTVPNFMKSFKGEIFSANIDCDLYEGYNETLRPTYERAVKGALIYLDEFYSLKFPGARIAVEEFSKIEGLNPTLLSSNQNEFERWGILK